MISFWKQYLRSLLFDFNLSSFFSLNCCSTVADCLNATHWIASIYFSLFLLNDVIFVYSFDFLSSFFFWFVFRLSLTCRSNRFFFSFILTSSVASLNQQQLTVIIIRCRRLTEKLVRNETLSRIKAKKKDEPTTPTTLNVKRKITSFYFFFLLPFFLSCLI